MIIIKINPSSGGKEYMDRFAIQVDARKYEPKDKHITIFEAFDKLIPGESMELINDHDPRPLYYQFKAERTGEFEWEYMEEGPGVWRIAISKRITL